MSNKEDDKTINEQGPVPIVRPEDHPWFDLPKAPKTKKKKGEEFKIEPWMNPELHDIDPVVQASPGIQAYNKYAKGLEAFKAAQKKPPIDKKTGVRYEKWEDVPQSTLDDFVEKKSIEQQSKEEKVQYLDISGLKPIYKKDYGPGGKGVTKQGLEDPGFSYRRSYNTDWTPKQRQQDIDRLTRGLKTIQNRLDTVKNEYDKAYTTNSPMGQDSPYNEWFEGEGSSYIKEIEALENSIMVHKARISHQDKEIKKVDDIPKSKAEKDLADRSVGDLMKSGIFNDPETLKNALKTGGIDFEDIPLSVKNYGSGEGWWDINEDPKFDEMREAGIDPLIYKRYEKVKHQLAFGLGKKPGELTPFDVQDHQGTPEDIVQRVLYISYENQDKLPVETEMSPANVLLKQRLEKTLREYKKITTGVTSKYMDTLEEFRESVTAGSPEARTHEKGNIKHTLPYNINTTQGTDVQRYNDKQRDFDVRDGANIFGNGVVRYVAGTIPIPKLPYGAITTEQRKTFSNWMSDNGWAYSLNNQRWEKMHEVTEKQLEMVEKLSDKNTSDALRQRRFQLLTYNDPRMMMSNSGLTQPGRIAVTEGLSRHYFYNKGRGIDNEEKSRLVFHPVYGYILLSKDIDNWTQNDINDMGQEFADSYNIKPFEQTEVRFAGSRGKAEVLGYGGKMYPPSVVRYDQAVEMWNNTFYYGTSNYMFISDPKKIENSIIEQYKQEGRILKLGAYQNAGPLRSTLAGILMPFHEASKTSATGAEGVAVTGPLRDKEIHPAAVPGLNYKFGDRKITFSEYLHDKTLTSEDRRKFINDYEMYRMTFNSLNDKSIFNSGTTQRIEPQLTFNGVLRAYEDLSEWDNLTNFEKFYGKPGSLTRERREKQIRDIVTIRNKYVGRGADKTRRTMLLPGTTFDWEWIGSFFGGETAEDRDLANSIYVGEDTIFQLITGQRGPYEFEVKATKADPGIFGETFGDVLGLGSGLTIKSSPFSPASSTAVNVQKFNSETYDDTNLSDIQSGIAWFGILATLFGGPKGSGASRALGGQKAITKIAKHRQALKILQTQRSKVQAGATQSGVRITQNKIKINDKKLKKTQDEIEEITRSGSAQGMGRSAQAAQNRLAKLRANARKLKKNEISLNRQLKRRTSPNFQSKAKAQLEKINKRIESRKRAIKIEQGNIGFHVNGYPDEFTNSTFLGAGKPTARNIRNTAEHHNRLVNARLKGIREGDANGYTWGVSKVDEAGNPVIGKLDDVGQPGSAYRYGKDSAGKDVVQVRNETAAREIKYYEEMLGNGALARRKKELSDDLINRLGPRQQELKNISQRRKLTNKEAKELQDLNADIYLARTEMGMIMNPRGAQAKINELKKAEWVNVNDLPTTHWGRKRWEMMNGRDPKFLGSGKLKGGEKLRPGRKAQLEAEGIDLYKRQKKHEQVISARPTERGKPKINPDTGAPVAEESLKFHSMHEMKVWENTLGGLFTGKSSRLNVYGEGMDAVKVAALNRQGERIAMWNLERLSWAGNMMRDVARSTGGATTRAGIRESLKNTYRRWVMMPATPGLGGQLGNIPVLSRVFLRPRTLLHGTWMSSVALGTYAVVNDRTPFQDERQNWNLHRVLGFVYSPFMETYHMKAGGKGSIPSDFIDKRKIGRKTTKKVPEKDDQGKIIKNDDGTIKYKEIEIFEPDLLGAYEEKDFLSWFLLASTEDYNFDRKGNLVYQEDGAPRLQYEINIINLMKDPRYEDVIKKYGEYRTAEVVNFLESKRQVDAWDKYISEDPNRATITNDEGDRFFNKEHEMYKKWINWSTEGLKKLGITTKNYSNLWNSPEDEKGKLDFEHPLLKSGKARKFMMPQGWWQFESAQKAAINAVAEKAQKFQDDYTAIHKYGFDLPVEWWSNARSVNVGDLDGLHGGESGYDTGIMISPHSNSPSNATYNMANYLYRLYNTNEKGGFEPEQIAKLIQAGILLDKTTAVARSKEGMRQPILGRTVVINGEYKVAAGSEFYLTNDKGEKRKLDTNNKEDAALIKKCMGGTSDPPCNSVKSKLLTKDLNEYYKFKTDENGKIKINPNNINMRRLWFYSIGEHKNQSNYNKLVKDLPTGNNLKKLASQLKIPVTKNMEDREIQMKIMQKKYPWLFDASTFSFTNKRDDISSRFNLDIDSKHLKTVSLDREEKVPTGKDIRSARLLIERLKETYVDEAGKKDTDSQFTFGALKYVQNYLKALRYGKKSKSLVPIMSPVEIKYYDKLNTVRSLIRSGAASEKDKTTRLNYNPNELVNFLERLAVLRTGSNKVPPPKLTNSLLSNKVLISLDRDGAPDPDTEMYDPRAFGITKDMYLRNLMDNVGIPMPEVKSTPDDSFTPGIKLNEYYNKVSGGDFSGVDYAVIQYDKAQNAAANAKAFQERIAKSAKKGNPDWVDGKYKVPTNEDLEATKTILEKLKNTDISLFPGAKGRQNPEKYKKIIIKRLESNINQISKVISNNENKDKKTKIVIGTKYEVPKLKNIEDATKASTKATQDAIDANQEVFKEKGSDDPAEWEDP